MSFFKWIISVVLLSTLLYSSNKDLEKVSVQLNWKYQFEYAGFIVAKEKGLICTLDSATIEDIVLGAKDLEPVLTDELLLESFLYYYDYDAFLPEPGFKPLSNDELMQKIDRDFYDCLGEERKEIKCRNSVCERGAIEGSVYCKIHHFEMMQKKPCPFTD